MCVKYLINKDIDANRVSVLVGSMRQLFFLFLSHSILFLFGYWHTLAHTSYDVT